MASVSTISTPRLGANVSSTILAPSLNGYLLDVGVMVPCGQANYCFKFSRFHVVRVPQFLTWPWCQATEMGLTIVVLEVA
jgi:hypothetical protein